MSINHFRQEMLSFLYEKQRKIEAINVRITGGFGRKEKAAASLPNRSR